MKFRIDNMVCGGCVRGVTRAVQSVDPNAIVVADPPSRIVDITSQVPSEQIAAALRDAQFPPVTIQADHSGA